MVTPDALRTGWATAWAESGAVNRGGRMAKASQPADGEGGAAAADSAAARTRGRLRRQPSNFSNDSFIKYPSPDSGLRRVVSLLNFRTDEKLYRRANILKSSQDPRQAHRRRRSNFPVHGF